jgi:catechol 2,3-dioxygenase-like lactoylglutathione lyase family enzyme
MTTGIRHDHIALIVSDLERSARFYHLLGGRTVSRPSADFCEILIGELRLHLVRARTPHHETGRPGTGTRPAHRIDHICLQVGSQAELSDLAAVLNKSESAAAFGPFLIQQSPPLGPGATHCEERPPLATLYFRDPDGLGLEARCYQP